MFTRSGRFCVLFVFLLCLVLGATGCVSSGRYNAMKAEATEAKQQLKEAQVAYAEEKLRVLTLEKQTAALQAQTEKYQANLTESITKLESLSENWGQVRDDLIRLNMDRELQRMRQANPDAKGVILLEPTGRKVAREQTAQTAEKVITPETQQDELNRVIEQFRNLLKK